MKVKVLFFGATADAVGKREIDFEPSEGAKVEDVFNEILNAFPGLRNNFDKSSLLLALNQEYANGGEIVRSGDEIAVFTPVSGG